MSPMSKEMQWRDLIPYAITGILNEHTRAARAMRQTDQKDKYAEFYEELYEAID